MLNLPFDRSRYMRNWWMARLCHGCKFLHVGESVDHNHCDCKFGGDPHWQDKRVNGWHNSPKTYDNKIRCSNYKSKPKNE